MKSHKKNLNIIFFGSPQFAIPSLDTIIKRKHNLLALVTVEDKKSGRGLKLRSSSVKKFAMDRKIKVIQPSNLKSPSFVKEIKKLNPDLQVVIGFRKLPKEIWSIPKLGTINLHASLLPQYRGSAPINWSIINGEKKTGLTTFFINDQIDKGNIILQKELQIEPNENATKLHDKLSIIGANLTSDTIDMIKEGNLKTYKQKEYKDLKVAFKLNKENCKINWNDNIENIHNKIRGLSYYPGAWCFFVNNKKEYNIKIFDSKLESIKKHNNYKVGKVEKKGKELLVHLKDGILILKELQIENKRKMKALDFLNGTNIFDDCYVR